MSSELNLTTFVTPKLQNNLLNGVGTIEKIEVRLVDSTIATKSDKITLFFWKFFSGKKGTSILNSIIQEGTLIPDYMGIRLAGRITKVVRIRISDSSSLSLLDGYIRADLDIARKSKLLINV